MSDEPFRAENHFLPRLYLRAFEDRDRHVFVYRTLVSHSSVDRWERKATKNLGRIRHLYSVELDGEVSDEVERFLEREFETPAASALSKALADQRLEPRDWEQLIRFASAQDLRTPSRLLETVERLRGFVPAHHAELVEKYAAIASESIAAQLRASSPPEVTHETALGVMVQLLTNSLPKVPKTGWSIVRPAPGYSWFTSDVPLVRLNYYPDGSHDFKGGWNRPGGNLFVPLSPQHLMIREVGRRLPRRGEALSVEATRQMRGFLAEHAEDMVIAAQPDSEVEVLRPRVVDDAEYERRKEYWKSLGDSFS